MEKTMRIRFRLIKQVYSSWLEKGDRLLDVGCGNGYIAKCVADSFSVSVTGADVENLLEFPMNFRIIKFDGVFSTYATSR